MARLIAIDLGAYAVKVAVFEGSGKTHTFEEQAAARVPASEGERPTLGDRLASLDLLLRDHPHLATAHLAEATWSGDRVSVHRVKVPFDDPEKIMQTLPFTVEAEVPFDLDDKVLAWRPSSVEGEVIACVAATDVLRSVIDGLAERNMDPRRIHADGEVLGRYAPEGEGATAVIDVGHLHTSVAVGSEGTTRFQHALDVAGASFTRAIQRALECSWADAQALKHSLSDDDDVIPAAAPTVEVEVSLDDAEVELGLEDEVDDEPHLALDLSDDTDPSLAPPDEADPADAPERVPEEGVTDTEITMSGIDVPRTAEVQLAEPTDPALAAGLPAQALQAVQDTLGLFLAEVRSALIEAEDSLGVDITRVVLVGGGSRLPDLSRYLETDLGVPVQRRVTLDGEPIAPEFALSRALADRMVADDHTGLIDLRAGELAYTGGTDFTRALTTYGGAGLGFFLAAVVVVFAIQYRALVNEQSEVDARIHAVVSEAVGELPDSMSSTAVVSTLSGMVLEAEEEADFLGSPDALPETVDVLYKISTALPPHTEVKLNVDELEISPNAISMEGVTQDIAGVDSLAEGLRESGWFREVASEPGGKDRSGKRQFTIDIDRTAEEGEGGSESTEEG